MQKRFLQKVTKETKGNSNELAELRYFEAVGLKICLWVFCDLVVQ